ncbi:MAG: hypothetical protein ACI8S6_003986 [Myxococcota bacterium]
MPLEEVKMTYRLKGALALLVSLGLACGATVPGEASVEVEECSDGSDIDDATLIAWEFEESVHEMITCGSLTFQLIYALVETAQTILTDPAGLPGGFSFDDGQYVTTGVGVSMDLVLRYGPDSPGGEAGETIPYNVFDLDSYLTDASAVEEDGVVTVTFSEPGPLVALIGRGGAPSSPLVLTEADLASFSANLAGLKLKSQIHVDHEKVSSVITYEIDNPAVFVSNALLGMQLDMSLVGAATGVRDDLGQSLETTTWDVTYGELAGTLDGVIEAEVVGGPFDFHLRYDYSPVAVDPAITVTCL